MEGRQDRGQAGGNSPARANDISDDQAHDPATDHGRAGYAARVAIFAATSGHSGVDRIIANLVPAMTERGIAVDVLKVEGHGPDLEQLPPGARVIRLHSRHANTSLPALVRYLRRVRPDAMLSDKDRVNRTALWAASLSRVPLRRVVRFGTTVSLNLRNKKALERWTQTRSIRLFYRSADAVITPSRGVADDLVEQFQLPAARVHVVHNPVVTPGLQHQARMVDASTAWPWKDDGVPVIIGVGALVARKDWPTLIQAFARLWRQRRCRLLLMGDGPEHQALATLAEACGVARDVAFTGFVKNPYPSIKRAHVLALTSRWEGMGVVLAEALALGTQVVATDCPSGPAEVLQNGRAGFLAPVANVQAVAAALDRALNKPLPRKTLTDAASLYTVARSAEAYLDVLGLTDRVRDYQRAHNHALSSTGRR